MAAVFSPAQALVLGTADTGNSIPFGSYLGGYYYQQVYNKTNFSGSMNINELTFYNTASPGGTPSPGTFDVYLSIVSFGVGAIPTDFPQGFPASVTNVWSGTLPAITDGRLDLNLTTAFNYDPSLGNLLLTIRSFDTYVAGSIFLDFDEHAGTVFSRRLYAGGGNQDSGLVTGFNDPLVSPTPLPAALPLFASGLGALGIMRWRKKRKSAATA